MNQTVAADGEPVGRMHGNSNLRKNNGGDLSRPRCEQVTQVLSDYFPKLKPTVTPNDGSLPVSPRGMATLGRIEML